MAKQHGPKLWKQMVAHSQELKRRREEEKKGRGERVHYLVTSYEAIQRKLFCTSWNSEVRGRIASEFPHARTWDPPVLTRQPQSYFPGHYLL